MRGVVVGKFLPPHAGHHHLIRTALAGCDGGVDVLVCSLDRDPIPAAVRAAWLREVHPAADVHVVVDDIPDDLGDETSSRWAKRAVEVLGHSPDVVYSSEDYGSRWAHFMGAAHVSVDPARGAFPVSGTAVRNDPAGHWSFLEAPVRAGLCKRVCIIGAESTGTTTLSRALASHYATEWVPEYGREYSILKQDAGDEEWRTEEFTLIARRQQEDEDAAARRGGPVLICDTDALATTVWHERYMGFPSPPVIELAAARTYDLYVLTGCEIPFEQDGLRDGEHLRPWMTERFREVLATRPEPWIEVTGSHEERMATVTAVIDRMLTDWRIPF